MTDEDKNALALANEVTRAAKDGWSVERADMDLADHVRRLVAEVDGANARARAMAKDSQAQMRIERDAAIARAEQAESEVEQLRKELHAPLKDWRPDMKRWIADVLLREASEVDGDEPRPSRELVYETRLALHAALGQRDRLIAEVRALAKFIRNPPGLDDAIGSVAAQRLDEIADHGGKP